MQYPGYISGNTKLIEGQSYPFSICNHLQMQDGEWYYILRDINGLKHFMPSGFYKEFAFQIGNDILCRIDKINCTGRIFLEPRHPFYQEGEIYHFSLANSSDRENETVINVLDVFENCIEVPVYGNLKSWLSETNKVRCYIKSIRKGVPILELVPKIYYLVL